MTAIEENLSNLITGSSSDGFGIVLYDTLIPSWEAAARFVVGEGAMASSRLSVTSADGLTTTDMSLDEFCARPHAEPVLTMSADWNLDEMMDGYVQCTCKHDSRTATECYQYGTLERLEATFLDVLLLRLVVVVRSFGQGMLAVDASGSSGDDEWRKVYKEGVDIPQTAIVVAMPTGVFRSDASQFSRAFSRYGIEVFAATE